jgi:hypothetical protein
MDQDYTLTPLCTVFTSLLDTCRALEAPHHPSGPSLCWLSFSSKMTEASKASHMLWNEGVQPPTENIQVMGGLCKDDGSGRMLRLPVSTHI